jgi:hypothetical protein
MQTLKFKDKVKKKCKEFLAVTLISSSLLLVNTGCDNKDDSIYGNSDYVVVDKDTENEKNDDDKKVPVNDEVNEEREDEEKQDEDLIEIDEEINDEFENDEDNIFKPDEENLDEDVIPDEEERLCVNTGTKYIVNCEALREAYEDECLDFIVVGKLLAENCKLSSEIDLETEGGKCYVPSYITGNAPVQGTNACLAHLLMKTIKLRIEQNFHVNDPEAYQNQINTTTKLFLYSYLAQKYVRDEDIFFIVTYPSDNVNEKYLIPGYVNSFDYGGRNYKMLNEHVDVLHEMEFINIDSSYKTRLRMYMGDLYHLEKFPFFTLDLMKCPMEENNEASIAVLGFVENRQLIENDPKYKKHFNGGCDNYYKQKADEFVKVVLGD